jgi:uncharacterized SAM-binding protein YcdF (DUF218 family)
MRQSLLVRGLVALVLTAALLSAWPRLAEYLGTQLISEDRLKPAQAIVVLAGGYPQREYEASYVYREGLAPRIILVREWTDERTSPSDGKPPLWQRRRDALVSFGVPASAIEFADRSACMTSDELQVAAQLLKLDGTPVILVTSSYHTQRVELLWQRMFGSSAPGLMRAAPDPAFPGKWWQSRRATVRLLREYIGLFTARLPLPLRTTPCGEDFLLLVKIGRWLQG